MRGYLTFARTVIREHLPQGPVLAQLRSADRVGKCLLLGVDRTYGGHHEIDAFDPKQTRTRTRIARVGPFVASNRARRTQATGTDIVMSFSVVDQERRNLKYQTMPL